MPRYRSWMLSTWGVAVASRGHVVGVTGHWRSKFRARRAAADAAARLDDDGRHDLSFAAVSRSNRRSVDWGVDPLNPRGSEAR